MTEDVLEYPERISLAQLPTPLLPLDRLGAALRSEGLRLPRIWVKRDDLSHCAASGNKIRKLEFSLAAARAGGCDTLITCGGLQSNHCRATAVLGAQLGLQVHLLLRGDPGIDVPRGNLLLDQLCGARISCYEPHAYQQSLPQLLQYWHDHYQQQGRRPFVIPTGASDGIGVWGYLNCARELRADFRSAGIAPAYIFHATGSGGTQAGLSAGTRLYQLGAQVWGMAVCDNESYFLNKVRADLRDWQRRYPQQTASLDLEQLELQVNADYIGAGYAIASEAIFNTIQQLAELEGLILDPVYTAKAFHGMLCELRAGRFNDTGDVVFIHTGGLFGLLAQQDGLSFNRLQMTSV